MTMASRTDQDVARWFEAGLIDAATADRIRRFEQEASQHKDKQLRWPILLALALGGIMLAAGVLLFVAAHWDRLSPAERFSLVLTMTAVFHIGAGFAASRFSALAAVLHAVGTMTLGAGIFLTGQIFNLQEHWPTGVLLWAVGAAAAWAITRHWAQGALTAILAPGWAISEWVERTRHTPLQSELAVAGVAMLAIVYFAGLPESRTPLRRALKWIGGLVLLQSMIAVAVIALEPAWTRQRWQEPGIVIAALFAFVAVPTAFCLGRVEGHRRLPWEATGAAAWIMLIFLLGQALAHSELVAYPWAALAAIGMVLWGLRDKRRERINMGVAGFGVTVIAFYFSSVMDKLGRSFSLIGLGLLFLLGGWGLERTRRKLVALTRTKGASA
jgi:uncharacterized membrane protein